MYELIVELKPHNYSSIIRCLLYKFCCCTIMLACMCFCVAVCVCECVILYNLFFFSCQVGIRLKSTMSYIQDNSFCKHKKYIYTERNKIHACQHNHLSLAHTHLCQYVYTIHTCRYLISFMYHVWVCMCNCVSLYMYKYVHVAKFKTSSNNKHP